MTEPRRLREARPESLEARLLDAVQSDQPSTESRERLLAAIGAAGLGGVGAASALAAKTTAKASWLAIAGKLAVVAAGTGVLATQLVPSAPPARPHASVSERAAAGRPARRGEDAVSAALLEPSAPHDPAAAAAALGAPPSAADDVDQAHRGPVMRASSRASARPPAAFGLLSDELAALRSIRHALAQKNARAAVEQLARYQHDFPRGDLAQEAALLRVEAHLQLGELAEAVRVGRTLLEQSPHGPYARKLRRLLAESAAAEKEISAEPPGQ